MVKHLRGEEVTPPRKKGRLRRRGRSQERVNRVAVVREFRRRFPEGTEAEVEWEGKWLGAVVKEEARHEAGVWVDFGEGECAVVAWSEVKERVREAAEKEEKANPTRKLQEYICKSCGQSCEAALCDGEWYWRCPEENTFQAWDGDAGATASRQGPHCLCGQPSRLAPRTENGKAWICAKTSVGGQCDFVQDVTESPMNHDDAPPAAAFSGEATDEEFLVGVEVLRPLNELFRVPWNGLKNGGRSAQSGYHDALEVVRAWRVRETDRRCRYEEKKASVRVVPEDERSERPNAVADLNLDLDAAKNEHLLLHGTSSKVVASILQHNLNPDLARAGRFGSGTYFADEAAKIDQYLEGSSTDPPELVNRLYGGGHDRPAGDLYYALVCRVVLGAPAVTDDGRVDARTGEPLFADDPHKRGYFTTAKVLNDRRAHALKVRKGGEAEHFNEYVVFDKDALDVEFVVALRRVKRYCRCGQVLSERTKKFDGVFRTYVACPDSHRDAQNNWVGGCGFVGTLLPRCYCRRALEKIGEFHSAVLEDDALVCRARHWRSGRGCGFRQPLLYTPQEPLRFVTADDHLPGDDDSFIVHDSDTEYQDTEASETEDDQCLSTDEQNPSPTMDHDDDISSSHEASVNDDHDHDDISSSDEASVDDDHDDDDRAVSTTPATRSRTAQMRTPQKQETPDNTADDDSEAEYDFPSPEEKNDNSDDRAVSTTPATRSRTAQMRTPQKQQTPDNTVDDDSEAEYDFSSPEEEKNDNSDDRAVSTTPATRSRTARMRTPQKQETPDNTVDDDSEAEYDFSSPQ